MEDLLQYLEISPKPLTSEMKNDSVDGWLQGVTFVDTISKSKPDIANTWLQEVTFFDNTKHFPHIQYRKKKKKHGSLLSQALAARYKPEFLKEANAIRRQLISDHLSRQAENYWILIKHQSTAG